MKNLFFILLITLPFFANAQQTEGKIIFKETVQIQFDMPEEHRQMMGNMPTSQSATKVLHFTSKESLYKNFDNNEELEVEGSSEDDEMQIKIIFATPETFFHKDLETNNKIVQENFMGKNFLIEDNLEAFKWKIMADQKLILNYPCTKAVYQDSTQNIEAWFTSQIPVANGPDTYGQLPGMILELITDGGDQVFIAQEVIFEKQLSENLEAPHKGKKVNQAEFNEIVAHKIKEMKEEMGGSGMMIEIRN